MAVGVSNQPYPWVMKTRINPPHPQPGPIAFAVVCAFGGLVAVRGMLQLRIGTEPWWVSLLAIAMLIPALVLIERDGRVEALLTVGYWEPKRIRELVDALRAHAVELDQSWVGAYPPAV